MSDCNDSFSMDGGDVPLPTWLLAEHEDRIRAADELPFLRPSLRREFISEVTTIDQQRERRRRVVVAMIGMLALVPLWWLAQQWPERAIAQHVPFEMRAHSMVPTDTEASLEILPESLVGAVRNPDAFKLVDAFSELKQQHSVSLGKSAISLRSE